MSREIKFRVWDIDNKRMFRNCFKLNKKGNEVWVQFENQSSDNLIWEQFTGLKDKNGVDIYEGDIVSTRTLNAELNDLDFENYEVGFFNGTFCLIKNEQAIRQWKDGTNDWYSLENTESFEIKVIGNIHENKN